MCFFVLDPRIKSYFFMNSIWPVFFVLSVYLLFVFKIGPEFMKHRKPFNIDRIVKVYNCVQILLNFYLLEEVREHFIKRIQNVCYTSKYV